MRLWSPEEPQALKDALREEFGPRAIPCMPWFVYILRCSDDSRYTGITSDLDRRLKEHNSGKGGRYTRTRTPVSLVYQEIYEMRGEALRREAQLKGLSRARKRELATEGHAELKRPSKGKQT